MPYYQIIFKLFLAVFLGSLIGLEREYKKKAAGLKTYSLVSLGSALFVLISSPLFLSSEMQSGMNLDPSRVIAAVVVGVGFIGAGIIIQRQDRIEGLTSAAGLWMAAAIGGSVGFGFYFPAVFSTFLVILIFAGFSAFEEKILKKKG